MEETLRPNGSLKYGHVQEAGAPNPAHLRLPSEIHQAMQGIHPLRFGGVEKDNPVRASCRCWLP
jgi:hypothetical protein